MRVKVGETATVRTYIRLKYTCSQCGQANNALDEVSASSSTSMLFGIRLSPDFATVAKYELINKLEYLQNGDPAEAFADIKLNCACAKCGYREPWARIGSPITDEPRVMRIASTIGAVVPALIALFAGGKFLSILLLAALGAGIAALAVFLYKLYLQEYMKHLTTELPKCSLPKVELLK